MRDGETQCVGASFADAAHGCAQTETDTSAMRSKHVLGMTALAAQPLRSQVLTAASEARAVDHNLAGLSDCDCRGAWVMRNSRIACVKTSLHSEAVSLVTAAVQQRNMPVKRWLKCYETF